jgi:hypothetical protein
LRRGRRLNENNQIKETDGWGMQHAWYGWTQDRHCMYNVTMRRVPVTIVAMEKKTNSCIFWVCVCIRSYPKCKEHASYCFVICGPSGSTVFPRCLISGTNFGKKVTEWKCVFWCPLHLWSETFTILRILHPDTIINVRGSLCKVPVIVVRFKWKFNLSTDFREKYTHISHFMKIPQVGAELFHADTHDLAVSRLSQFCERA